MRSAPCAQTTTDWLVPAHAYARHCLDLPSWRSASPVPTEPSWTAAQFTLEQHDPAGNRLTVLELDGTRVTYTNDASYQLTREQRGGAHPIDDTLQYDGVGNRVSKVDASGTTTYQVNAANELVLTTPPTGAPTTSTWDAEGNLARTVSRSHAGMMAGP